ncbi:MAG: hypothetical protein K8S27_02590 [Candidatus Omnitrophica bacterium]|nr:hypothetical protein [Candidatus Omnitrophota bacterium]
MKRKKSYIWKRLQILTLYCCLLCFVPSVQAVEKKTLICDIKDPASHALVRGDVPVYGRVGGSNFKEYFLEYGAGFAPEKWQVIRHSQVPQMDPTGRSSKNSDLVHTSPGNLGLWRTGLPEFSDDGPVDLPVGHYTLRLRVVGHAGESVEHKIPVEVGRLALNCMPNTISTKDKKARLVIPEHSLQEAVKVFSLKAVPQSEVMIGGDHSSRLVSPLYRLRPADVAFTLPASFRIAFDPDREGEKQKVGIGYFNVEQKKWDILPTQLDEQSGYYQVFLEQTPSQFAVFGLFEGPLIESTLSESYEKEMSQSIMSVLNANSFQEGLGRWKNKHGLRGATVQLVEDGCEEGLCLSIKNNSVKGNYAAIAYDEIFDAAQYPILEFDYRMGPEVKVDIFLKVGGKWFEILFSDDEKIYWGIQVEKIGSVGDVRKDSLWHHVQLNLLDMLKERTDSFYIEEIVFADWDSTGFKKLEYGSTPAQSVYWIDNFQIRSDRYFWQIGWADESGEEFSPNIGGKDVFVIGDAFFDFPHIMDKETKIVFEKEQRFNHDRFYIVSFQSLDPLSEAQRENVTLRFNGREVAPQQELTTEKRMDFIVDNIQEGRNELVFQNSSDLIGVDMIAMYPVGRIPWAINALDASSHPLVIGNFINRQNNPSQGSFANKDVYVVFDVEDVTRHYKLELWPTTDVYPVKSWLFQKKVDVIVNDQLLAQVPYGLDNEPTEVHIPSNVLRPGLNHLRLLNDDAASLDFYKIVFH